MLVIIIAVVVLAAAVLAGLFFRYQVYINISSSCRFRLIAFSVYLAFLHCFSRSLSLTSKNTCFLTSSHSICLLHFLCIFFPVPSFDSYFRFSTFTIPIYTHCHQFSECICIFFLLIVILIISLLQHFSLTTKISAVIMNCTKNKVNRFYGDNYY